MAESQRDPQLRAFIANYTLPRADQGFGGMIDRAGHADWPRARRAVVVRTIVRTIEGIIVGFSILTNIERREKALAFTLDEAIEYLADFILHGLAPVQDATPAPPPEEDSP